MAVLESPCNVNIELINNDVFLTFNIVHEIGCFTHSFKLSTNVHDYRHIGEKTVISLKTLRILHGISGISKLTCWIERGTGIYFRLHNETTEMFPPVFLCNQL